MFLDKAPGSGPALTRERWLELLTAAALEDGLSAAAAAEYGRWKVEALAATGALAEAA